MKVYTCPKCHGWVQPGMAQCPHCYTYITFPAGSITQRDNQYGSGDSAWGWAVASILLAGVPVLGTIIGVYTFRRSSSIIVKIIAGFMVAVSLVFAFSMAYMAIFGAAK